MLKGSLLTFLVSCLFLCSRLQAQPPLDTLTIESAQALALMNNPEYMAKLQDEEAAHWTYLQYVSKWFPSVTLSTTANFKESSNITHSGRFSLSQPIFSSDKWYDVSLYHTDWVIKRIYSLNSKNDILLKVRKNFYEVVLAYERLLVAEDNVKLLEKALEEEESKQELGNGSHFRVNQSQVALSNALASYYSKVSAWKQSRLSLIQTMGIDPSKAPFYRIKERAIPVEEIDLIAKKLNELMHRDHQSSILVEMSKKILESREKHLLEDQFSHAIFSEEEIGAFEAHAAVSGPDILVKDLELKKANYEVSKKKGAYLPSVTLSANYSNSLNPNERHPFATAYDYNGTLNLNWTLFNGLDRERQLKQKVSELSSKKFNLEHTKHSTLRKVQDNFFSLEQAMFTYAIAKSSVELANESMEQAQSRYKWGTITPLEYREAAAQLVRAKESYLSASYTLFSAYYQLIHDCGLEIKDDYILAEGAPVGANGSEAIGDK